MKFKAIIESLTARLPELEWQLSKRGYFSARILPRGLFRCDSEADKTAYVKEIKADLLRLGQQSSTSATLHLAKAIEQKINVLVMICHQSLDKKVNVNKNSFSLDVIATRKQWFESLEGRVKTLTGQRDALALTLARKRTDGLKEEMVVLQAELGEVEKQLTLCKEALSELLIGK